MIATGGYNENGIKIWDVETSKLLSTIKQQEWAWSLTWTSDEKKLIAGLRNGPGSIRIFDTATLQLIAVLEGHKNAVKSVTLFPNDHLLASTSWDCTARLWDLDTHLQVGPPLPHEKDVECAAFSADGKLLSTGCADKNVYIWDIQAILKAASLEGLLPVPNTPKVAQDMEDKSFWEADATRGFGQFEASDVLSPRFFHHTAARPSAIPSARPNFSAFLSSLLRRSRSNEATGTQQLPVPLGSRLGTLIGHLSSHFRSPPHADEAIKLQHRPWPITSSHCSRVVDVAAMQDREVIFVARQPETASEMAKRIKNPKLWVRVVLFLCCVSPGTDTSPNTDETHSRT